MAHSSAHSYTRSSAHSSARGSSNSSAQSSTYSSAQAQLKSTYHFTNHLSNLKKHLKSSRDYISKFSSSSQVPTDLGSSQFTAHSSAHRSPSQLTPSAHSSPPQLTTHRRSEVTGCWRACGEPIRGGMWCEDCRSHRRRTLRKQARLERAIPNYSGLGVGTRANFSKTECVV